MYVTMTPKEVEAMLREQGKPLPYKFVGHSFKPLKGTGKQCCTGCGLMALRNRLTNWCVAKGCNSDSHPQYKSTLKRLTRGKP